MILSKLLPVVVGLGAGILVSAGVFTVLLSVGLVPRFAGKTHTGEKIFLYEEMVVFGTLVGCLASVFPGAVIFGREWLQKRLEACCISGILFFGKNSVINDGSCSRFRFGKEQLMENYQTDQSFQKQYEKYVKQVTPTHNLALQMLHAFVTGGAICTVGQIILNVAKLNGLDDAAAGSVCAILLVLASALLTGFNIYPSLVKWGGAGALVPITGFANSVAAPAIEFQKEGQVFGIGCKIFTIAGPVILYGIFVSWVLGLIGWIGSLL